MPSIWVKDFNGGLDTRRLPETSAGGVLLRARNGHISRGGEFEQRGAFVPEYTLPAGTVGMSQDVNSIVVFGSGTTPSGMPSGIRYQRLQHPSGATLVRVPSSDMYRGKIYAVGEFSDGTIHHYYDGVRVTDWFDGRALARFNVVSGAAATPGTAASATIVVQPSLEDPVLGYGFSSVVIHGQQALTGLVPFTVDQETTAALLASAINASGLGYTATASGVQVVIWSPIGASYNGRVVSSVQETDAGVMTLSTNMAGGANPTNPRVNSIVVNGVNITGSAIPWAGTREAMASALATAINAHISTPEYTATVRGTEVFIKATTPGTAINGRPVTINVADGVTVNPPNTTMSGGAAPPSGSSYVPGTFVQTIGSKVYATSGSTMHFSGIREPTQWTTDAVGAGFIDMSEESSGAEELKALARYQDLVAVFADRSIQTWFVDPDPDLNRQVQVLSNTGTSSPRSVTAFGDADIFYLDESGLRSLRARDSSNAAATTDIGIPIDGLVTDKLAAMTFTDRQNIVGLIEPVSGRFWLSMGDRAFVFSFFPGSKISAWSEYIYEYTQGNAQTKFNVTDILPFRRRVYARAGNDIFVYTGLSGTAYDASPAEAWMPYLDANDPTRRKQFEGVDAAVRGEWIMDAAWYISDEEAQDRVATVWETTYDVNGRIPAHNTATHVSLRFTSKGEGPHKLASCVIHFDGPEKPE